MRISRLLFAALLAALSLPCVMAAEYFAYIGTYTAKESKGIYAFRFDSATGKATEIGLVAETVNPSFVTIHPNRKYLYAVNEIATYEGQPGGSVSAYAIDRSTGKLKFLNKVATGGGAPCHLVVDKTGKSLLVANYSGGSVAAFPVKADGSLGEKSSFIQHSGSSVNPKRQQGPHAHSINHSPDNKFAVVADLGLDQVLVYRLDPAKASLTANNPPFAKVNPGGGPRHFAFHPTARFAYVINELQSTITAFSYDAARGALTELQTITTLPKDFSGVSHTAEVQVHPNGRFVYGSNRGHDSIAIFSVDAAKGTLTPVDITSTQGKTPRNFGIDPTGAWLFAANQATDNIVLFRIDANTGRLTPTGQVLQVSSPVCVKFLPVQ